MRRGGDGNEGEVGGGERGVRKGGGGIYCLEEGKSPDFCRSRIQQRNSCFLISIRRHSCKATYERHSPGPLIDSSFLP